jgi:branched-chain amino acid transport system permease protein
MKGSAKLITGLVVLGGLIYVPWVVKNPYYLHIIIMSGIFVLLASSLNLITGCTGRLNLGHAAFYGIGAYGSTLVVMKLGFPVWFGMVMGGLITVFFGVLIGIPCLKLKGSYLAITTLAFGEITRLAMINFVPLTNGPLGIRGIPGPPAIGFGSTPLISFESKTSYYYLVLVICVLCLLTIRKVLNSQIGRTFMAIREDEVRAETVGIDTIQVKIMNFALGAFFAGIAGSFYAHYVRFISPDTFTLGETFTILTMVVIGGLGTFYGPIVGGVIFTFLPELLRAIAEYRMIIYGLMLSVAIIFMPDGIVGLFQSWISGRTEKGDKST